MHLRIRNVPGLGLVALALLIAMPLTTQAAGRAAFVNGIPGKTVEICVNGKELTSRLKYAKAHVRRLGNGAKNLRIRASSNGTCKGKVLGKRMFVVSDDDLTIVATKLAPNKVIIQTNTDPAVPASLVVVRHAADIGTAGFKYHTPDDGTPWFDNAADDPWQKGSWGSGSLPAGMLMLWWAHVPPDQSAIAGPLQLTVAAATRHEIVLVGTNLRNVRFVRFTVPVPLPG